MVRTYIATGNPIYKRHFEEILAIRDGKMPRPRDYQNIYWDLVLPDDRRPGPAGPAIPLLEMFRQAGFTGSEFAKLSEAKRYSDELTRTEFTAMRLIESATATPENFKAAINLLYSNAYHQAKANIMKPVNEFYRLVDARTLNAVQHAEKAATALRYAFIAISIVWLGTLFRMYRCLTLILGGSVKQLYQTITRLGDSDFSTPVAISENQKDSVMAWLLETQKKLADIDAKRNLAESDNRRLTRFYAVLSQCNQAIIRTTNQNELFETICRDAVTFGGLKMVWIGLIEPGSPKVVPVACFGEGKEYLEGIDITIDAALASGQGPGGKALRDDCPFWCQDFQHDPSTANWHERAKPFGWLSSACLPIHKQGRVVGGIMLYAGEINAFGREEQDLLLEMVADIDFALAYFDREKQRKANAASLAQSNALLRTIIDTAPVRIFWKDTVSRYLGCNTLFAQDAGAASELELLGKDDTQLCWHQHAALYQADDRHVMATGEPKLGFEEAQTTPNGQQIWLKTSKVPLRDAHHAIIGLIGVYEDITVQKRTEEHLRLAASVFDHSNEAIMVTDAACNIIDVNGAFTRLTGHEHNEVLGKNPRLLSSGLHGADFYTSMWQTLLATGQWTGEIWNRHKNGEHYAERLSINSVKGENGAVQYYVGMFSDITDLKHHQQQLEYLAHYDPLTHLPNRVLLTDRLQQALAHAQRYGQKVALIYIDLDGFKEVNDQYGHACGDELLIQISQHMKSVLRDCDTLARLGGDEFVVVLPELDDMATCQRIIDRLLAVAASPFQVNGLQLRVSASIGVALHPQTNGIEPDQLVRQADQAMYQAKLAGRNRYWFFDADNDQLMRDRNEKLIRIRKALNNNEFVLFYQPKIDLCTQQVIGVEGLIRWLDPEKGLISPAEFLPLLDKHSLHIELGHWVLRAALGQLERWRTSGIELSVSINIDGVHLQHPGFLDEIRLALEKYPHVNPADLELEVLESSALDDIVGVCSVMNACKNLGIQFALDDFGTGYSSLTYLKRLPVKVLKIDQSFVRDMLNDPDDLSILSGVIGLAHAFGRDCIAEGVETGAHAQKLLEMGCHYAQGYAFAKPMPVEDFEVWLREWQSKNALKH